MKRVNLDPNEPYVGNRPLKLEGVQLIRRHDQRRPMIDLAEADKLAELELARRSAIEEKERSRAEHQAKLGGLGAAAKVKAGDLEAQAQKGVIVAVGVCHTAPRGQAHSKSAVGRQRNRARDERPACGQKDLKRRVGLVGAVARRDDVQAGESQRHDRLAAPESN